ncbi:MAG: hypothetical protein IKC24_04195 [Oscillospiraceae bacterium]|nr:hypothetical protein [Oscillospiraceae bacterium]
MSIETEYVALREEILKRVEIRYALVSLTITIAGSMLSFSLQMIQLALLYPVIAMSICCMWAQNEMRELQLCDYIHTVEKKCKFGWSKYYKEVQAQGSFFYGIPLSVVAPGSVFILSSSISLGIARKILFTSLVRTLMSILDFLSIFFMVYLIFRIKNCRLSKRSKAKR